MRKLFWTQRLVEQIALLRHRSSNGWAIQSVSSSLRLPTLRTSQDDAPDRSLLVRSWRDRPSPQSQMKLCSNLIESTGTCAESWVRNSLFRNRQAKFRCPCFSGRSNCPAPSAYGARWTWSYSVWKAWSNWYQAPHRHFARLFRLRRRLRHDISIRQPYEVNGDLIRLGRSNEKKSGSCSK